LRFLPRTLAVLLGVPLVAAAVALFSYSVAKFRGAGTPVPARKPTTVIVRTGPYGFSRNPVYLAATLVGAVAVIHYVVIPTEERYLERKFGEQYLDYKASVRPWL
jgi:protein-S-isoprenylcysteine O-methyltransferase Ste14